MHSQCLATQHRRARSASNCRKATRRMPFDKSNGHITLNGHTTVKIGPQRSIVSYSANLTAATRGLGRKQGLPRQFYSTALVVGCLTCRLTS